MSHSHCIGVLHELLITFPFTCIEIFIVPKFIIFITLRFIFIHFTFEIELIEQNKQVHCIPVIYLGVSPSDIMGNSLGILWGYLPFTCTCSQCTLSFLFPFFLLFTCGNCYLNTTHHIAHWYYVL